MDGEAADHDYRALAEPVGEAPGRKEHAGVERGNDEEPGACPDGGPVQDVADVQRHDGAAHPDDG